MIVVDASLLVAALAEDGANGELARARLAGQRPIAPEIIDLEVTSVVRTLVARERVTEQRAERAIVSLTAMRLRRIRHRLLVSRCWELRHNASPYDAAYLATAERYGLTLVTADTKLAGVPGVGCDVEVVVAGS